PANAYQTFVFRSPVAHAVIETLDVTEARDADGVKAVYTCADLEAAGVQTMISATLVKNQDGSDGAKTDRHVLAKGRVRFVGEPVAFVVADTLAQARDAAELIEFDYDELPAKLDLVAGGEVLHDTAPDNVAYDWGMGDKDATDAAFDAAAHVVSLDVEDNRVIVNAMEPRGCYAEPEGARLHVAVNGQGVWGPKGNISAALGMAPDDLRVTNPDTGGGFG
ncbi:MAG: molybdopterin cofactor-binding domain-containing protein, partial [Pseudomonadota bacterium]